MPTPDIEIRDPALPLKLRTLFGNAHPVWIEIGFGRGEFLVQMAEKHPERNWLGLEIKDNRFSITAREAARRGLTNVRLILSKAQRFFEEAFREGSLDGVVINFPDPWPKDRHWQNRLMQPWFIERLSSVLRPGGRLSFGTDDAVYAEETFALLSAHFCFRNLLSPEWRTEQIEGYPRTYFQEKKCDETRPPNFLLFERIKPGQGKKP